MSEYKVEAKISNEQADLVSNIQAGSIIAAGFFLAVAGVCTCLLKVDIKEIQGD